MSGDRLHGRDGELAAIDGALSAVAGGGRRVVLLRGEPGIGKTRLVAEAASRARALGFVVLQGHATELEREVPFVPVTEALGPRLSGFPGGAFAGIGEEGRAQLARVLPGLGPAPAAPTGEDAAERWRLHRALAEVIALAGAGRPVALLLDDLHWADPATLEFAEHVLRRPPAAALALVLAMRPGDAADRLRAAAGAARAGGVVTLEVGPLSRQAADALMAGLDDAGRDRAFRESGGNPFLLAEMARGGGAEVPGGVVAAVRAELAALGPTERALASAAAVAGDPFDLDLAIGVAGLREAEALPALDALAARAIVRPTGDPRRLAFRHPLIRSALYTAMAPGARLAAHRAAADALAAAGAPAPAQAQHLAHAAAPGDRAAAATLRAAAARVRPQAPGVAADWLLAARRAEPSATDDDLSALAEVLTEAGRLLAALEVVDAAPAASGSEAAARLAATGASVERTLGRHGAARRRLERALASTPDADPATARLMADLALSAYVGGDQAAMLAWARRARDAPGAGAAVTAASAMMLAAGHAGAGDAAAAEAEAQVAEESVGAAADEELAAAAELLTAVPWGLVALERLDAALAAASRIAGAARRAGNAGGAVQLDLAAVLALGLLGRVGEAAALADRVEQTARMTAGAQSLQWALWMRAWVLIEAGDLDAALSAAEESVELSSRVDDSALSSIARTVLGAVLAARGEPEAGRALLARYAIEPGWVCRWSPALVEADIAAGDLDAARAHAERAGEAATQCGLTGARAAAGRALALVALAEGAPDRAAQLARESAQAARAAGGALDEARARLVAGRALATSDRAAALAEMQAAEAAALERGAARLRDEARREMRRLGHRVGHGGTRGAGGGGLASLSGREREIAGHVAAGRTNREIGRRLYLSEKTVETHLSHVFAKLGVRSRAEVAARVAAQGADPDAAA